MGPCCMKANGQLRLLEKVWRRPGTEGYRRGHPGDDKLIMELMDSDLEALRGLTGSG